MVLAVAGFSALLLLSILLAVMQSEPVVASLPAQLDSTLSAVTGIETDAGTIVVSTDPWIEYARDRMIVKVRSGVDLRVQGQDGEVQASSLASTLNSLGVVDVEPLFAPAMGTVQAAQHPESSHRGLERIYRLRMTGQIPLDHALALLRTDPNVEYAEPDYVARAVRVPNDPEYPQQWYLPHVGAPNAWDATTGSNQVIIAVIDSGIDTDHPDLSGQLWVNSAEVPNNGQDDDLNGYVDDLHGWNSINDSPQIEDDNGHGTQVAGVIAASTDNGSGVAGLCWSCRLMVLKAMQSSGIANYSDIAEAIVYAASNGARIINVSLGGYADSALVRDAIQEAATTAVVVAGAGNDDSTTPFYPAAYPEVIAVASTGQNDQKSVFSNFGPWVDIAAPGELIRTTQIGGYVTVDGTSLSASMVAGVAGLLRSAHPDWSPELVKWQLLNTAFSIDSLNPTLVGQLGYGRLDAAAALGTTPQPNARVESYAIDGVSGARPEPGQSFLLALTLRNLWVPAANLVGTLTTSDPYATVTDGQGTFGSVDSGQMGSNAADPFGLTLAGNAPYNHPILFNLVLNGDNGYQLSLPFTLTVRSGEEVLGNTMYVEDTVWTADKTYILNGTVIVGQGVTLTIQPGTVIKGNPDKFIRVDGTLIARGTAEAPILFTTNSVTGTRWSGIRFTDSAMDAWFDPQGNYQGGSVLQHVIVERAAIGASLGSRAPYIADSTFQDNGMAIQVGSNGNGGSPRIERSQFTRNSTAINLQGGRPTISYNTFRNTGEGITGSGSPEVTNNIFQDNSGWAIHLWCCSDPRMTLPSIRNNVILNNGGSIYAAGFHNVDIQGNLIASNGGDIWLDVNRSVYLYSIDIAYNQEQDNYLVTWSDTDGMQNLATKFQRLGGTAQPLASPVPWQCVERATLAYNPADGSYLAASIGVPYNRGILEAKLCLQNLGISGSPTGTLNIITSTSIINTRVVYHSQSQQHILLWQGGNVDDWRLYAQALSADIAPFGNPIQIGQDLQQQEWYGPLSLYDATYDPVNDRTLVVFQGDNFSSRLWGAWIRSTSSLTVSTSFTITQDPQGRRLWNAAAAYGDGRYLVVWERGLDMGERALVGMLLNADGTPATGPITVTQNVAAYQPAVAYNSSAQEFLIAWVQGPEISSGNIHEVMVQRLNTQGALLGTPITLRTAGENDDNSYVSTPKVVYNSTRNEYLVAWIDNRQGTPAVPAFYGQRLDVNGQLLDNDWTPEDESQPSVNFLLVQPQDGIRYNTIIDNQGNGISLQGYRLRSLIISDNNLFGNKGQYEIYVEHSSPGSQNFTINATNNFWNLPTNQIAARIRDCTFDENACNTPSSTLPKVAFTPVRSEPDPEAPAFAHNVSLSPDPVGDETGLLTVDFSRPMITETMPTALFHDARRGTVAQMLDYPVQAMAVDVIGRLWVAGGWAHPGVRYYDGRDWYAQAGITGTINAIYGASNGDVWFARNDNDLRLYRLQGATVLTYTAQITPGGWMEGISSIGEDLQGNMWFGTWNGAWRYDGVQWRRFTTAEGLVHNSVMAIARDGQGRMWFRTEQGLSVFDGVTWRTYNQSSGLPTSQFSDLFADSQGRVWVALDRYDEPDWNRRKYVAMYDGAGWTFYGPSETNGLLSCEVSWLAEDARGRIWMKACSQQILVFDGQNWSQMDIQPEPGGPVIMDTRGNLWYVRDRLYVRWGGLDYSFTDGQWLSPTRFQASYDFTPQILPGSYRAEVQGAMDSEGMPAYAGTGQTFQVDFGTAVSTLRPHPPQVQAETDGRLSHLRANWTPVAGDKVDLYRYAIGSFPGGRDVLGWTYTADNQVERTDLRLQAGQSYYVVVQARSLENGLWSADGRSNAVVGGVVTEPPTELQQIYLPIVRR
uniref:S8 family serine peptidase n=1 Tax=Litorilinea aerophila TaxID=1204385 RepID=A0A540VEF0_9CHLR